MLQLLSTGFLEKVCLLEDLERVEVAYTNGLLAAIDIEALDERVLLRSGRHTDLNLRVFAGKGGEVVLQESAAVYEVGTSVRGRPWVHIIR